MVLAAFFSPSLPKLLEEKEGQYKRGGTGKGSHRCTSRPGLDPLSPPLASHLAHPRLPP